MTILAGPSPGTPGLHAAGRSGRAGGGSQASFAAWPQGVRRRELLLVLVMQGALVVALHVSAGLPWWALWLSVLLAPWVEETVFRLGLHEAMWRRAVPRALRVLAVAGLFSAAHAWHHGALQLVGVFGVGLLLGAVYERWRALGPCVALHAAMNAVFLAVSAGLPWR